MWTPRPVSRRQALAQVSALAAAMALPPNAAQAAEAQLKRPIPSSGELLPAVGLGTWQAFDVAGDAEGLAAVRETLRLFVLAGGRAVDSSPMYRSSESVVGDTAAALGVQSSLFLATKVWTSGRDEGIRQMQTSMQRMRTKRMDLMQVHNLVDWQTHLKTLRNWKEEGRIRYFGFTHYTVDSHRELARLLKKERPDFVQFNYSIATRNAEKELLPVAAETGTATILNRPFEEGDLFRIVRGKTLPPWAAEIGCESWAQFFLKYLLGHPAVSCVIPGTREPRHIADNMCAGLGRLPDETLRARMAKYMDNL
jgi:diketogulonate reductase-like aldo/keto reductase